MTEKIKITPLEENILELLRKSSLTLKDLSYELRSSKESIKVTIWRLRKKGFVILHPRKQTPRAIRKDVPQVYTLVESEFDEKEIA